MPTPADPWLAPGPTFGPVRPRSSAASLKPFLDAKPLRVARDNPEAAAARKRMTPSADDYISAVGSSIKRAPSGVPMLAGMVPQAYNALDDYLTRTHPSKVLRDAGHLAALAGKYVVQNPLSFATDVAPIVGSVKGYGQMINDAAHARSAGDIDMAHALESMAVPMTAVSLVPELGAAAKLATRAGTRAVEGEAIRAVEEGMGPKVAIPYARVRPGSPYIAKTEGPFLHIKREGAQPVVIPRARKAGLDEQRAILANPETNQPLQIADAYNRENFGRGYDAQFPDPGTSLRKQSGIGRAFQLAAEGDPAYKSTLFEQYGQRMPEVVEASGAQNYDQLTEAAYRKLAQETQRQFGTLPVELRYHYGEGEYAKPSEMLSDVLGGGRLNVFRGGDPHPYLSDIDPDTGLTANEQFRAVHDYFGHGTRGATFRPGGEELAYASHSQMMSPLAQMALASETRGQNSFVNYSPLNADLTYNMRRIRAQIDELRRGDRMRGQPGASMDDISSLNAQLRDLGSQTQFAPQTPLLLPPEFLSPSTEGGIPDWLQAINNPKFPSAPERAVHLSHTPGLTSTDPSWYGTGHRGDDWAYRGKAGSPEHKTSFYLGAEGTVNPESMVADVSPHAYQTQLSGLYDIAQDPEQLVTLAKAYSVGKPLPRGYVQPHIPDFMRMVREYGYSGIRNPNFMGAQGAADVFDPVGGLQSIVRGPNGYAEGGAVE